MKKTLIVKTGRSETFAPSKLATPSLGDVVRSTVLLRAFPGSEISWLTSSEAAPLLRGHPRIASLFLEDMPVPWNDFDLILNLETDERWISEILGSRAEKRGFLSLDEIADKSRRHPGLSWSRALLQMAGAEGPVDESPWLPARENETAERFDIGLNWASGPKWPTKAWPKAKWAELYERLAGTHAVSWQRGFDSLSEYRDWIASCRAIVTLDSLGLHLALATEKKVVALFGPTSAADFSMGDRGLALSPAAGAFACAPCLQPSCSKSFSCMDALSVDRVESAVRSVLGVSAGFEATA